MRKSLLEFWHPVLLTLEGRPSYCVHPSRTDAKDRMGIIQAGRCSPHKAGGLNSIPWNTRRKLGWQNCWATSQNKLARPRLSQTACLQTRGGELLKRTPNINAWPQCTREYPYTCTYSHIHTHTAKHVRTHVYVVENFNPNPRFLAHISPFSSWIGNTQNHPIYNNT